MNKAPRASKAIQHPALSPAGILGAAMLIAVVLLSSCGDPLDLFAEYRGVNLIQNYQFDQPEWVPDHSGANPYMTWEAVSGADLSTAQAASGYTDLVSANGGSAPAIYRLEVKNQFVNGDFQVSTPGLAGTGNEANIGANWVTSHNNTGSGTIQVLDSSGNYSLRFNNLDDLGDLDTDLETLYVDLAANLSSYADASASSVFAFHMDFVQSSGEAVKFQFSDGSASLFSTAAYAYLLPILASGSAINFPGDYDSGSNNFIPKSALYNRLYFGSTDLQQQFNGEIDNIRFLRIDTGYAVRLKVPFRDESGTRPDLPEGGEYVFSVYILEDPGIGSAGQENRFDAEQIALELKGIAPDSLGSTSYLGNLDTSAASAWTKLEIRGSGIVMEDPVDPASYMIELAISASALGTAIDDAEGNTVYQLDAGSIILAMPALEYSPDY